MNEYQFSLTFTLKDPQADPETFVDALFEAGCDDAMPGIGKLGYLALEFIREAPNALESVTSAIADAKKAIPNATLIEVTPDMGGISDLAEILSCSRQNIRQLIFSDPNIPPPLHEGKSPIWHMAEVLSHFASQQRCDVMPEIIDLTSVNWAINSQITSRQQQIILGSLYPTAVEYFNKIESLLEAH